ncbi:DUF4160 domain-containing protein [Roseixanthobacter glucoisosaccharinicivorans]|uniref:DUF4160 domain-containing protein n=1 Tax=Roseixanthobacter glucoisosaccharinicivorans TaxID=3119923 RepID=UPI0037264D0B
MPTIAIVEGMKILVYSNEHGVPHFHVLYAEHRVVIEIETLDVLEGDLPRAKLRTILEWAQPRKSQIFLQWTNATTGLPTERIP